MLERTERISFRIYFVLSKVEPGAGPSHRLRLRPKRTGTGSDRFRLRNTDLSEAPPPSCGINTLLPENNGLTLLVWAHATQIKAPDVERSAQEKMVTKIWTVIRFARFLLSVPGTLFFHLWASEKNFQGHVSQLFYTASEKIQNVPSR